MQIDTAVQRNAAGAPTFERVERRWAGRRQVDRLIQQYPPGQTSTAEHSSLSGGALKPVRIPGS